MSQFHYYTNLSDLNEDRDNVFIISAGITSKKLLLDVLYITLKLPGYFGFNWDALKDAITDREALSSTMHIVHLDLPLSNDEESTRTYLEILQIAEKYLNSNPAPFTGAGGIVDRQIGFEVWFPKDIEGKVEELLKVKQ